MNYVIVRFFTTKESFYRMSSQATDTLETFPNPKSERDFTIRIDVPEFTCLCPKTGQPDFATLEIEYIPDELCVELKALKLYVWSYRDQGAFHEAVTNKILDDLVAATSPRYMRLTTTVVYTPPRTLNIAVNLI